MCRGTVNGEDVYIIPIHLIPKDLLSTFNEAWIQNHGGIPIDKCIGKEVQELLLNKIETVSSCCGHGEFAPHVLLREKSKEDIERLGYTTTPFRWGLLSAYLKTGENVQRNTAKLE